MSAAKLTLQYPGFDHNWDYPTPWREPFQFLGGAGSGPLIKVKCIKCDYELWGHISYTFFEKLKLK